MFSELYTESNIFHFRDWKSNWLKSPWIQYQKLRHTQKVKKICLNGSHLLGDLTDQFMKMEFSNLNYHSQSNTLSNHQIVNSRHEFIIAILIRKEMFALIFYRYEKIQLQSRFYKGRALTSKSHKTISFRGSSKFTH